MIEKRKEIMRQIDTSFDLRTDGKSDPDKYSPTLRKFHQLLWSKKLPVGGELILDEKLVNHSAAGEFHFASDSIIHTFSYYKACQNIICQIPRDVLDFFEYQSYTIGAMLIFPGECKGRTRTINVARGFHPWIKDRIDLTLECIRLFYKGQESPLYNCLQAYRSFFDLFGDFKGYVDFFLLQDMVNEDYSAIRFFHPFERFGKDILPADKAEYVRYMNCCLDFIKKRNNRMAWYQ